MPGPERPSAAPRGGWRPYALSTAVGAVGLLMMHHPMILSGLRRVQVDLGDTRLINYLLEHNYLWYRGEPTHREFWNPPFFYPARNIAAYSDTMLGIAPLYGAFRAAGSAPDTSFQLWLMTVSTLNYLAMIHLLARRLGQSIPAASAGAFLFAFGSPRANMVSPAPQLPQFLSLITVDALFGLFTGGSAPWYRRAGLWLLAAAGLLAQLSSGYYTGWFTVLSLGIVAVLSTWKDATRGPFLATLRRDAPWIAVAALLGGLAIRPWLAHHLAAARELGPRFLQWALLNLPRVWSWLDTGPWNWLGGLAGGLSGPHSPGDDARRTPLGIGLTTTAAALAGLWLARGRASTRLLATAAAILGLCLTLLPVSLVTAAETLLIVGPVAFAFDERGTQPRTFLATVGLVLLLLSLKVIPGAALVGAGIATLTIAVAAFLGRGGDRRGGLALGALILGLAARLVPSPVVLGIGAVFGGLLALAAALLGWRSRPRLESVALGAALLFGVLVTHGATPIVWLGAPGALVVVAAVRRSTARPPARLLLNLALAGFAIGVLFEAGSAWPWFYVHVPGANSMIFVSRVGLMMLIPAAVGLGYAVDALRAGGRPALALAVGLVCLLEQGTTTPSFDKAANRERIAALARWVSGWAEAFYYSPSDVEFPPALWNLDAMWAGIASGKPTVNGYSGHTPRGWRALDEPKETGPGALPELERALSRWKDGPGRAVPSVQWIGSPPERHGPAPSRAEAPPGH